MAINMFTKPAEFKYVELPFEAIAAAGAARQKRYDEGDKLTSDINDTFLKIGSREADTPRKQELVNDYQKQIYDVVDSYSGDIGAALPKIKELQRKINYDMAYGELGAIKKNYEAEQARIKVVQDSNQNYNEGKGGLDAFDATNLLEFEKQLNAGPTKKVGNTWSTYQTHSLSATQDYSKAAREIADKIDIQTLENFSGMKHVGNGIFMDEKKTEERRDKDIIAEYVTNALLSDPKYAQYLDWKNTISGKKSAVARTLQNDVVTTPNGVQYLAQKDAAGNEVAAINPTEWANETLISDFRKAGQSAGEIYQRLKVTRDRKYATPDLSGGKEENPYAVRPLNTPNVPLATAIKGLQTNVVGIASGAGTVKVTREQAYGPDGKLKPGITVNYPAATGQLGTPIGEVTFTKKVEKYDDVVSSLSPVDRARLDYVIQIGTLKGRKPTTPNDWKLLQNDLNQIGATAQYSGVVGAYENADTRRKEGEIYNANMQNFMFFDETGALTSALPKDLQNGSRVYSGTELRNAGIKISELTGKMTTSSSAPKAISVGNASYTFAAPDVVLMKTADGREITGLVGRNKAQIDGGYIAEVLESSIKSSSATGLPEALFPGSEYVVMPNPNDPYSFSINKYDNNGQIVENVNVKANNATELRQSVLGIWNNPDSPTSANIRTELQNNLFR